MAAKSRSAPPQLPTDLPAEWVAIDSVKPFPGNAKVGDVSAIQVSIRKNGVYRPLYVQKSTRHVMAGNHTLKALRAEGHDHVWVWWHDCDDETAERINLADNRLPELGGYDTEALIVQLGKLPSLEGTGYSQADMAKMLGDTPELPSAGAGVPDDDYAAQLGVIVLCETPDQQQAVYERLQGLVSASPDWAGVELKVVAV